METPNLFNRNSEIIGAPKHSTAISALTPMSSCKRSLPGTTDEPESESQHATKRSQETSETAKRRRLSPPSLSIPANMERKADLLTPPSSPTGPAVRTMRLKVEIPKPEPTKDEQRTLKNREAAAKRWKSKLQRPFPMKREITQAYPCKLLRHYTGSCSSTAPNFVKPTIHRSPRVDKLREAFPLLPTFAEPMKLPAYENGFPTPNEHVAVKTEDLARHEKVLRQNKRITRSEHAQKQAWKAFSSSEKDRVDRGREAMMQSGLFEDDLDRECMGKSNGLPEWRKNRTSRFARERLAE